MKLAVLIVAIVALCVAAIFIFKPTVFPYLPSADSFIATTTPPAPTSSRSVLAGQKEYFNATYRISLLYPEILTVTEFKEEGGAMTVTFENFGESKGFQIFIVPFAEAQITNERFKQDAPSGVRKNMKDVAIDGATGASFYSENDLLGETAEVWFVKNNYLYEVSTFRGLDIWLQDILKTWMFI